MLDTTICPKPSYPVETIKSDIVLRDLFKTKQAKRAVFLLVLFFTATGILVAWLWLSHEGSPWAEATTPATLSCESENCVDLLPIDAGHGGQEALRLAYDPAIDDAVAQWGDCLASVLTCRRETGNTRNCVQASTCPEMCRSGFAVAAADQTVEAELGQLFLSYFVEDGGACVPAEEEAQ